MTVPTQQPNLMHQIVLASLLDPKTTVRSEIRHKRDAKNRWVSVVVDVPVPTIAGNVSELNVDRASRRWLPARLKAA